MPIQMPRGAPNQVKSFPGVPGGVNQAVPPSEIDDAQGQIIQDAFVSRPSYLTRRGPVQPLGGSPLLAYPGVGLATALAPDGTVFVAGWSGDSTHGKMEILNPSLSAVQATYTWPNNLPHTDHYPIFWARPALNQGTMVGISNVAGRITGSQYAEARITIPRVTYANIDGKTITIGTTVYTIKNPINNSIAGHVRGPSSGNDTNDIPRRLAAAINDSGVGKGTDYSNATSAHPDVTATTDGDSVIVVRAKVIGSAGNSIALSTTASASWVQLPGSTLAGGTDAAGSEQTLGYWTGGASADLTATITVTRGSKSVTGTSTTFTSTVTPGMWVISNSGKDLVGMVDTITDDTHLLLKDPALVAVSGASVLFTAIRGIYPRVMTGDITVSAGTTAVTGGATKFQDQGLGSGAWDLYRARDWTYIGSVASVTTNIALTLSANAAIGMASEAYVAIKRNDATLYTLTTADFNHLGYLTAAWGGHQWYANRATSVDETFRLWFSDPDDPEAVDTTQDGDWFSIPSVGNINTPVVGMIPCYNGLVVFKQDETFLLSGTTPADFVLRKMMKDGLLSPAGAVAYNSGAIWPGRDGIYYYKGIGTQYLEGIDVVNLTEQSLGYNWQKAIGNFNPATDKMNAMIAHDHYFLFVENYNSPVSITKGDTAVQPTQWTIVINMLTGSLVFMSNLPIRSSVELSFLAGSPALYLVNTTTNGVIGTSLDLYYSQGIDATDTDTGSIGPDFYFESKKFPFEDPLVLKRIKQLTLHHNNNGGRLMVDLIPGLNETATTLTSRLPDTLGAWQPHRMRFSKKSQYISFRLYQEDANITSLSIGAFQLKYKPLRPGRV